MKEKSRLRRFFRRYGADYAFVAPYTILFTVFSIVPVVMSMGLSLTYFNVLETPVFNGISNYLRLFLDDKLFLTAVKNTLLISVITGPIGFLLSYMLAWLISPVQPKAARVFYAAVLRAEHVWKRLPDLAADSEQRFPRTAQRVPDVDGVHSDADPVAAGHQVYARRRDCDDPVDEPGHQLPVLYRRFYECG